MSLVKFVPRSFILLDAVFNGILKIFLEKFLIVHYYCIESNRFLQINFVFCNFADFIY